MAFLDASTPHCPAPHGQHLTLGQACLEVATHNTHAPLQLWAQAEECYKCPPWLYLTLPPNTTSSLQVNTTYQTNLVITSIQGTDLYKLAYHFGEYGSYRLLLGSSSGEVEVKSHPESTALPLITAAMFLLLLTFMWQCAKFLLRRMDAAAAEEAMHETEEEISPLLSHNQGESSLLFPAPSTSSASVPSLISPTEIVLRAAALGQGIDNPQLFPVPFPDPRRGNGRLISLDAFRGLAIVLMIFVNYGGGGYYFFKHARWNGLTVADLVFPWFLWIMGVSMVFSIRSQLRRTIKRINIVGRILKRCILLFFLGLVVNSTNKHNYLPTLRVFGVLQRFSICYFLTAIIEVYAVNPQESPEYVWYWRMRDVVRSKVQWMFTLILVTIQMVLTFSLPVPGCPVGYLGPGGLHDWGMHKGCTGGAAGYIDSQVVGRKHMYSNPTCAVVYDSHTPYDPEGLLGAFTSVLMVQLGAACGRIIMTHQRHRERLVRWVGWAVVTGLLAGLLCNWQKEGGVIPVNKNLWSLSYVLCTASFAFILFAIFYIFIDYKRLWSGNPFRYAGMNSILLYVGHEICGGLFPLSWRPIGQHHANHLAMNLWATGFWVFVAFLCHRRELYFSV